MKRLEFSIENVGKALASLQEFIAEPVRTRRDRAGVIQAFEYTYEIFWKTFKKIAEQQGLSAPSPRQAITQAFQLGLIEVQDEELWLDMIKTRNETSHTYNETEAIRIVDAIQHKFLAGFERALHNTMSFIAGIIK